MYATIKSTDEYNADSKGRTFRVESSGVEVKADGVRLQITAVEYENSGGHRPFDAEPKSFVRAFNLALEPAEVLSILNAAIEAGIVKAKFTAGD